ncbi:phosphotransferase family protein [Bradyrhizobium sp. 23AC]
MMSSCADIRPYDRIDAAWMTAVLRHAGIDATVNRVTAQPVGTGQIGDSVRFRIEYAKAPEIAPSSLVGKFPSSNPESRAHAMRRANYLREVRFYQHLASSARIQTPRCWLADVDETTHDFVLLMEDLAPAEQGDQLTGVSLDQARSVLVQAAKLHASHWGDDSLDDLSWVSNSKASPSDGTSEQRIVSLWEGFKSRYRSWLRPDWIVVGDQIAPNFYHLVRLHDGPRCLAHCDFRPDNMMFASERGGKPVTVLDWQSYAYGLGATDVAYFLAGALPSGTRRRAEQDLLSLYHRTLIEEGVHGYDMDLLRRQYGRGGYLLFMTAAAAAMTVGRTSRGDRMFLQMLGAAAEHLLEHDACKL